VTTRNSFFVDDLDRGMVFESPLYSDKGFKLLEPYTPLEKRHFERLKQWRIKEVFVKSEPLTSTQQEELRRESEKPLLEPDELAGPPEKPEQQLKNKVDHEAVELARFYKQTDKTFVRASYQQALEGTEKLLDRLSRGAVARQQELFKTLRPVFSLIWDYKLLLLYLIHGQEIGDEDYFYKYSLNTSLLSMLLADQLNYEKEEIRYIGVGALIHDVGMLNIPQTVRKKEGSLNERERQIVQDHVKKSKTCFRRFRELDDRILKIVTQHHEHWDGSGYPQGLEKKKINSAARIVNLAMTYIAINQPRHHREQFGVARSIREVIYKDKKKFDPEALKAFVRIMGIYPPGSFVRLSSGHHALVIENKSDRPLNPVVRVISDPSGNILEEPYRLYLDKEKEKIESLLDNSIYGYYAFEMA